MSYTPTNWQTGDIITAARLNDIEQGIASNSMVILNYTNGSNPGEYVLEVSYNDLKDMLDAGQIPYIYFLSQEEVEEIVYEYRQYSKIKYLRSSPDGLSEDEVDVIGYEVAFEPDSNGIPALIGYTTDPNEPFTIQ